MYGRFSFCNSFPREAGDDMTLMKVNALEGALVETFPDKFPGLATVHQRAPVSVSASTQCGRGNQELSNGTFWCVSQEFLMRLFPIFFFHYVQVKPSGKRFVGILVALADPFQNSAENGVFRHPTRNSLHLVATICWFPH